MESNLLHDPALRLVPQGPARLDERAQVPSAEVGAGVPQHFTGKGEQGEGGGGGLPSLRLRRKRRRCICCCSSPFLPLFLPPGFPLPVLVLGWKGLLVVNGHLGDELKATTGAITTLSPSNSILSASSRCDGLGDQ